MRKRGLRTDPISPALMKGATLIKLFQPEDRKVCHKEKTMNLKMIAIPMLTVALAGAGCHAASNTAAPAGTLSQAADSVHWVNYTDNAEGAFSMDVPVGWQVEGGMYRFGYFDVRWMMDVRSLNGSVIIRIDDPNVPPYVLPGPHSGPAGHPAIRQGMYQMVVDNYREAQPYAEAYAKRRFGSSCSSMTERASDWTSDVATELAKSARREDDRGLDCLRLRDVGWTARGECLCAGFVVGNDGLWVVDPIISIIAKPDDLALAQQMTQHMIDSWQETPRWKDYQDQMTQMGLQQIKADFGRFMQQMQVYHQQREAAMNQQVAQFEARQQTQAAQVSSWGNTLTGLTNLYDQHTGTQFQVFSGPKSNYYMNGAGDKINSNINPGNGFYQVQNLGP